MFKSLFFVICRTSYLQFSFFLSQKPENLSSDGQLAEAEPRLENLEPKVEPTPKIEATSTDEVEQPEAEQPSPPDPRTEGEVEMVADRYFERPTLFSYYSGE